MITSARLADSAVVDVRVDGRIDGEAMTELRDVLRRTADEAGHVDVLLHIVDVGLVTPTAVWEDLRLAGELDRIRRIAVLVEPGWTARLARAEDAVLSSVEIETFHPTEDDEAMRWLRGGTGARATADDLEGRMRGR
ncbi:STAS/SEC14 domain-containing protein [Actinomycetospora cinnamomea]|uniref:SpoIIAA-like protein n=1 Tax=Actinomycetospora cinnamomea TaxID=663609 RepID=A0A2U1EVN5_9PSEU|nr:STAS/SEC14 domain-containing protein [Actinomycetospora cinnamomea]PVZ03971.1 SpoIIAA-like protein [Actinomycetospora cinnamomea]